MPRIVLIIVFVKLARYFIFFNQCFIRWATLFFFQRSVDSENASFGNLLRLSLLSVEKRWANNFCSPEHYQRTKAMMLNALSSTSLLRILINRQKQSISSKLEKISTFRTKSSLGVNRRELLWGLAVERVLFIHFAFDQLKNWQFCPRASFSVPNENYQ